MVRIKGPQDFPGLVGRMPAIGLAALAALMSGPLLMASERDMARMAVEARKVRETLVDDPLRPQYHLTPADARPIPRDQDRAAFQDGRYHLWFAVDHAGAKSLEHFSSIDLLHWRCHLTDDPEAPATGSLQLTDGSGRRIEWTWIEPDEKGSPSAAEAAHRTSAGAVLSLPRLVTAADGATQITPAPEVEKLRIRRATAEDVSATSDTPVLVPGIAGRVCELRLDLEPSGAGRFGVRVLRSGDGTAHVAVVYDPAKELLSLEVPQASGEPIVLDMAELAAAKAKPLSLRIFIDCSVVEAYANGQCVVAGQVKPGDVAAEGVAVFTEGAPVRTRSIECWEMAPSNPW
jgi:sucrose-6-phosphate hydrolase SacC (GH32 family)